MDDGATAMDATVLRRPAGGLGAAQQVDREPDASRGRKFRGTSGELSVDLSVDAAAADDGDAADADHADRQSGVSVDLRQRHRWQRPGSATQSTPGPR